MADEVKNVNNKERWKNRRRMAWTSLVAILVVTFLMFFAPVEIERLKVISEAITWFYFASASIIGAYMGFTSWSDKK